MHVVIKLIYLALALVNISLKICQHFEYKYFTVQSMKCENHSVIARYFLIKINCITLS